MTQIDKGTKAGPSRISVVRGGPGCGKTTAVGVFATRAVEQYGQDKVLVCSLTRAGARQAVRDVELPDDQLGTVHSFAYRALGSPVLAESKIAEFNAAYPEFSLSVQGATLDDVHQSENRTRADQVKLDVSRNRTMGIPMSAWGSADLVDFAEKWDDWKRQCGYADFADLIEQAYRDCDAPGDPDVILVDEAQDIGGAEMRLLLKWGKSVQHIVFYGDSQQCLFGFRGSDPLLLQRLWQEHDSKRPNLPRSYRLSQAVFDYAYQWATERFVQTTALSFIPRDVLGNVQLLAENFLQFSPVRLERLVDIYTQHSKTLMFQATCGYMLDHIVHTLRDLGVPFHNPAQGHGKWNPLSQGDRKHVTVTDRILAFMRPNASTWGEQARFWTVQDLKAWVGGLPVTGVLVRGKLKEIEALAEDVTDEDIAARMLGWFTPEALRQIVPAPSLKWYMDTMSKGSESARDYISEITQRRSVATLRHRPQVIVGGVHSLKGGEADTVVLCPDISRQAYTAIRQSEEAREEATRVFYVAITRARDNLLLCKPSSRLAASW